MEDVTATPATPVVEVPKHLTRTGIMLTLLPVVSGTLDQIPELKAALSAPVTKESFPIIRRAFRALLTLGIRMMLDAGVPPQTIFAEAGVAITNELNERGIKAKEDGATQAPATLPS
jgi:hypothetical protein